MTNKDKFLKDGVSVEEFVEAIEKEYPYDIEIGFGDIQEFLNAPVQPTLTKDERVILKHISIDFKYICRNGGLLYFNCVKGQKGYFGSPFGYNTFQFIKERRRILYKGIVRR